MPFTLLEVGVLWYLNFHATWLTVVMMESQSSVDLLPDRYALVKSPHANVLPLFFTHLLLRVCVKVGFVVGGCPGCHWNCGSPACPPAATTMHEETSCSAQHAFSITKQDIEIDMYPVDAVTLLFVVRHCSPEGVLMAPTLGPRPARMLT